MISEEDLKALIKSVQDLIEVVREEMDHVKMIDRRVDELEKQKDRKEGE